MNLLVERIAHIRRTRAAIAASGGSDDPGQGVEEANPSRLRVWGADDRLVPSVYADEFSKRLARARVHIISGAGHAPHLEHPAAVAGLVRDFLTATP